jgi:transcriptional regulator with XRE-family HTH domain
MQLGKKIRDLRCRRGLTVQQLAAASSLSKGFISQVENDRTSPSLATLKDLARALETSVAYLVLEDDQAPYVVRENQRPKLPLNGGHSRMELLSAPPRRNLELLHAEIQPGGTAGTEPEYPHGEECVLCLEGQVTVACAGHQLVLGSGDSCHYDGRAPHTIENTGTTIARVLIAVTAAAAEADLKPRASAKPNGEHIELGTVG